MLNALKSIAGLNYPKSQSAILLRSITMTIYSTQFDKDDKLPTKQLYVFFTIFEDDCSRLQTNLNQNDKINILKKNVLQKYRPYISLENYASVNELKHDLKLIEATMATTIDRNVSFISNTSTHSSRYDSSRRNSFGSRFQSQSPSNQTINRSGTPVPNEKSPNKQNDRSDTRNKSPYDEKRRSEPYEKNRNRSNSRESTSSQRYKSQANLNR